MEGFQIPHSRFQEAASPSGIWNLLFLGEEDDGGGRHRPRVCDRDFGGADMERGRAVEGPSAELEARFAAGFAAHEDFLEGHAAKPRPQRLHRRFLGSEPSGHVLGEGPGMSPPGQDLSRQEDAVEKPLAPAPQKLRDARDFRQVEPEKQAFHSPKKRAMRSASGRGSSAVAVRPRLASNSPAAWRRRSSIVASSSCTNCGCSRRIGASDSFSISTSIVSLTARTVAVRGSPVKRLISPNAAPAPSTVNSRLSPSAPWIETPTLPRSIRNIEELRSPSRTMVSPGA